MKVLLTISALVAMSVATFAQTTPEPADPKEPAVATRDAANAPAEADGSGEDSARARMEESGYTNVSDLTLGEDGVWSGRAEKDGTAVEVTLDSQGKVTEVMQ